MTMGWHVKLLLGAPFVAGFTLWSACNICFAGAAQLKIEAPAQVIFGQDFSVGVTAWNTQSQTVPLNSQAQISSSDTASTMTTSAQGAQVTLDARGQQTIAAIDPSGQPSTDPANVTVPSAESPELVICPPGQTSSCGPTKSSDPPFAVVAGQPVQFTIMAVQGDAKHSRDNSFNGSVQISYNLACGGASGPTVVALVNGTGTVTLTFTLPGPQSITATETSASLASTTAPLNVLTRSGAASVNGAPKYFVGSSFIVPLLPQGSNQTGGQDTPVGSWKGTASGEAVAFCDLLPGGNNANHCRAGPNVRVTMETDVQHTAEFEFAVANDGTVTGDGTITYNAVVSGTLAGGATTIGVGMRHFTFAGKVLGWRTPFGALPSSSCTQLPPGGQGLVLERDKNYEGGPIQLDFPCGGSGPITLTENPPSPGTPLNASTISSATGTIAPDGNLFDVCVPALGIALMQQPVSWDASKQELTLPFLLFGPTGSSGAYTIFKPPEITVKQQKADYQLQITSATVEGDSITASFGGNQSPLQLFAPFDRTPVNFSLDASGRLYLFVTSDKPGLGEPTTWQTFSNTWAARKSGGS